ncbi:efflux RND transporter permease subunit [Leptospira biflexa]|nr:efflux RND transporter permease subunit [Leptospira biflexa]TGM38369.1 efflux RND transporter permease subunit [Leptospira biflexa]TGM54896.1 efflux RND transporter permease subunit [Leptospira biflexa]
MSFTFVKRMKYQLFMVFGLIVLISILKIREIKLGDAKVMEDVETLVITQNWPSKTARQIEENVTKPWEMILKSVDGYLELKSISDHGNLALYLTLSPEFPKEELLQSVRNVYILNQNKFPRDIHFPRFVYDKDKEFHFILLKKVKSDRTSSLSDLEQRIKDIDYVTKFVYQPEFEREIQIKVDHLSLLQSSQPTMVQIYQSIRRHFEGVRMDTSREEYFVTDYPIKPMEWGKIQIQFGNFGKVSLGQIARVEVEQVDAKKNTRVNGKSFESILINTDSGFRQLLLELKLVGILKSFPDWEIVFSSQEELFTNTVELVFFYLLIESYLMIYLGLYKRRWLEVFVFSFSFLLFLIVVFFFLHLFQIPIGDSGFVFLFVLKLLFPFVRFQRVLYHKKQIAGFVLLFSVLLWLEWIPISIFVLIFIFFNSIVVYPFCRNLILVFLKRKYVPTLNLSTFQISFLNRILNPKPISNPGAFFMISGLVLLFSFFYSVEGLWVSFPITPNQGSIQHARLEFPTYTSESEINRVTRQVEEAILSQHWTKLLVATQKNFRSDFYLKLAELTNPQLFSTLPTEMGYFHFVKGKAVQDTNTLRFTNQDPIALEVSILKLLPWLKSRKEIKEVVLGFQKASEGLKFQSNSTHRVKMKADVDPTIKESSFQLNPTVVAKMPLEEKIVDVKLMLNKTISKEEFRKQPVPTRNGSLVFLDSFRNFSSIKNFGRIYHKNTETSMEILIKGESLPWETIEDGIRNFLKNDETEYAERTETKSGEPHFRLVFFVILVSVLFFRKQYYKEYVSFVITITFIWKFQSILFTRDYLQLSMVILVYLFFSFTIRKKNQCLAHTNTFIIGSLFLSYVYPWNGGVYLFESMFLIFAFGYFYQKSLHYLKIIQTS